MTDLEVYIDGRPWRCVSGDAEYDAIHAVAGALLAGADSVEVERLPEHRLEKAEPREQPEATDEEVAEAVTDGGEVDHDTVEEIRAHLMSFIEEDEELQSLLDDLLELDEEEFEAIAESVLEAAGGEG